MADVLVRNLTSGDWDAVRSIYLEGVATGQATFETAAPSWEKWDESHFPFARLGAVPGAENAIMGWAALSRVSTRAVYSGVAEVSVYIASAARGRGIGKQLLERLISESELHGVWTLQAAIFPENEASVGLHKLAGFRAIGKRERIAKLNGVWRDTLLLERRSTRVGID